MIVLLFGQTTYSINQEDIGVISGYFEPSGMYGGHSGYYQYIDYCPLCHHYNCLLNNPKGTYEGEITCGRCDADYDGTTGYDKSAGGARGQLERYYKVEEIEPQQNNTTNTTPNVEPIVVRSPLEQMVDIYNNNKII